MDKKQDREQKLREEVKKLRAKLEQKVYGINNMLTAVETVAGEGRVEDGEVYLLDAKQEFNKRYEDS